MKLDPVDLNVFHHLLAAIPEEMGVLLRRSAFSPNIKERLDFSCALTGSQGDMAAQASHIPVHLGSVHVTGRHLLERVDMRPGDLILLNDPYKGGTHLPDVTVFAPVFVPRRRGMMMGVMCRAHHADIGGAWPGSMGPVNDVHGEGLIIPPVRLVREGEMDEDILAMVLANTRTPDERRGDLLAQAAAVELGRRRVLELFEQHGARRLQAAVDGLRSHAARVTRATLRELPDGTWRSEASLDGPGTPKICVSISKRRDRLVVDFAGTDAAIDAPFNANEAITLSAVFYVVRLLVREDLPTNSGCLDPVTVRIPAGCLLNAQTPSPVAGGNVETSQRIVDVLLLALAEAAPDRVPACSQGTMNNLTAGGRRADGSPFTFYETLGGGAGGGPAGPGVSGIQTHMTNTLNTPIEALEAAYPVLVRQYRLRDGSGGAGRHEGGDGLIRELEARERMRVTMLAMRRSDGAPGVGGGASGAAGRDRVRTVGGKWRPLPAGQSVTLDPGDRIRVETPGGGGWRKG
ncbi:MAG: hydantoinase B/oxoprolinase family protein [Planctomycetota bacterium]|nr:hydantoinase B/oxoprolinase family protein [Planctomycetota bacterium]